MRWARIPVVFLLLHMLNKPLLRFQRGFNIHKVVKDAVSH